MFVGTKQFKRSLQRDFYTCESRSIFMVLRHLGRGLPHGEVKKKLGTNWWDGTATKPMMKLLRQQGLRVGYRPKMTFAALIKALAAGAVVIAWVDGDHLAVVHGADDHRVYLADPAITRCWGRSQRRDAFIARWMRRGLVVSKRKHCAKTPTVTVSRRRRRKDKR